MPTESTTYDKTLDLPDAMEKAACRSTISSITDGTMIDQQTKCNSHIKIETIEATTDRTCKSSGPCDCHIPLVATTPRWLRGVIGAAFFKFASVPLLNRRLCNYGRCRHNSNGTGALRFQYFLPTWLLPMGTEFAACWRSLGGIGGVWSLEIPQVVDDNFVHWSLTSALRNGAVVEVQRMMEHYGVWGFDMLTTLYREPISPLTVSARSSSTGFWANWEDCSRI